ncbi:MAG: 4Fe-4S cluster-binding domain-containing protein [Bacteroidales bacterium]
MPQTLITPDSLPLHKTKELEINSTLQVSELFINTLQGEGAHIGVPASFLRLKGCTLRCNWCDTLSVWQKGSRYAIKEILDMLEKSGAIDNLNRGQHLVITGGSPLLQEKAIINLLTEFNKRFNFLPFTEMENEAVLMPSDDIVELINCFNNSPKLSGSGETFQRRYKPEIIKKMSKIGSLKGKESWFKFVINNIDDWKEIEELYLPLIERKQIILMPQGDSRLELEKNRVSVAEIAMEQCVRFADREHIILYDKKTCV